MWRCCDVCPDCVIGISGALYRADFYKHIVLSGGSTMYPGLPSRVEREIKQLYLERVLKGDTKALSVCSHTHTHTDTQTHTHTHTPTCDTHTTPHHPPPPTHTHTHTPTHTHTHSQFLPAPLSFALETHQLWMCNRAVCHVISSFPHPQNSHTYNAHTQTLTHTQTDSHPYNTCTNACILKLRHTHINIHSDTHNLSMTAALQRRF